MNNRKKVATISKFFILVLLIYISFAPRLFAQAGNQNTTPIEDRPIRTLRDLNQAFVDIGNMVKPSVVTVSTESILTAQGTNPFANDPFFQFFFGPGQGQNGGQQKFLQRGLGSGIVVSADGYILTNNHVIDGADSIFVNLYDGRMFKATVKGADPKSDIAVIKIEADKLTPIKIGNSDSLQAGDIVMAVGSPMSKSLAYTVTQGIVSATGRANVGLATYEDYIQTDAAINPGNSGGPLVNLDGQLVGVNSAIASQSGGFQGIGFAVPSNMATRVMESLIATGKVVRGWLGVYIQNVNPQIAKAMNLKETSGALVGDVVPDSPADKAGMKSGDVITRFGDKPVTDATQLMNEVAELKPGTEVAVTVNRDGKQENLNVKLGEQPTEVTKAVKNTNLDQLLGFSVSGLTPHLRDQYNIGPDEKGVVITSIDPASAAARAGLRVGDLIRAVDRERVESTDDFNKILANAKKGDTILLTLSREGNGFFVAFTL
jgi:serine protease Do